MSPFCVHNLFVLIYVFKRQDRYKDCDGHKLNKKNQHDNMYSEFAVLKLLKL